MNRQSQQLVVASVVAFLTSGVITLAGLSAAEEMQPMQHTMDGGSTYTQPSGSTSYTQPANSGTSYQQQPAIDSTTPQDGGYQQHSPGTPTSGEIRFDNFQKDGANYQKDGFNFQKDGQGFHLGAPDFGGKTGAGRSFRDGFGDKEGAERAGGRFDRKGGFDHEPTADERNTFEGGNEETRKGMMKKYGGSDMGDASGQKGIFGKGGARSGYPMDGDMESKMKMMHGAQGEESPWGKVKTSAPTLPDLSNLMDLAEEEEEEVDLTDAQYESLEKLLTKFEKAEAKAEKNIAKLGRALDKDITDGDLSTKNEKAVIKNGKSVEGLGQQVGAVLEQLAEYADVVENDRFSALVSGLEAVKEDCDGLVSTLSSYLEE